MELLGRLLSIFVTSALNDLSLKLIDFTSWVFLFEASCDAVETEGKASRGLGGLGGAGGRGRNCRGPRGGK